LHRAGGFVFEAGWLQVDSIGDPKSGLFGFKMLTGTEAGMDGQPLFDGSSRARGCSG
jgi:hypothetical protein